MQKQKKDLILSALALVKVGKEVEHAKEKLRRLVSDGIPYDSPEMKKALDECLLLQQKWDRLEAEHLDIKIGMSV